MILVLDASPIIAFYSEIHEPQLLHDFINCDYKLFAPIAVINEIQKGRKPTWSILKKAIEEEKIKVITEFSSLEVSLFKTRYPSLDNGEIQVLILGKTLKNRKMEYLCVLDEGPARKIAIRHQISRTGTLGLLDKLNDLGIIDKKKKENLLNLLEHSKFRLKRSQV